MGAEAGAGLATTSHQKKKKERRRPCRGMPACTSCNSVCPHHLTINTMAASNIHFHFPSLMRIFLMANPNPEVIPEM